LQGQQIAAFMAHTGEPEAHELFGDKGETIAVALHGFLLGENAALAGRTARNIVLVYVDVRGLGRRVIVKRMAKNWVRGHIASARQEAAARK